MMEFDLFDHGEDRVIKANFKAMYLQRVMHPEILQALGYTRRCSVIGRPQYPGRKNRSHCSHCYAPQRRKVFSTAPQQPKEDKREDLERDSNAQECRSQI